MPVPPVSRVAGRAYALFASGVLLVSLIGFVLTVRDWRSGTSVGVVLVSAAVVLLGIGLVIEIPDFVEPRPTISRTQRLIRLALAAASMLLLAGAFWGVGLGS